MVTTNKEVALPLMALEGLKMGWCLFHGTQPTDGYDEGVKHLVSKICFKQPPAETLTYEDFVKLMMIFMRGSTEHINSLMILGSSMDAVGKIEDFAYTIVLAQKFGLLTYEEAVRIHQAGQSCSKHQPIRPKEKRPWVFP
jgi:hypothetical protein